MPTVWSPLAPSRSFGALSARIGAVPPPGTPRLLQRRLGVACSASSTRAFFSFISTLVASSTCWWIDSSLEIEEGTDFLPRQ